MALRREWRRQGETITAVRGALAAVLHVEVAADIGGAIEVRIVPALRV
jgi:hypothetical protein